MQVETRNVIYLVFAYHYFWKLPSKNKSSTRWHNQSGMHDLALKGENGLKVQLEKGKWYPKWPEEVVTEVAGPRPRGPWEAALSLCSIEAQGELWFRHKAPVPVGCAQMIMRKWTHACAHTERASTQLHEATLSFGSIKHTCFPLLFCSIPPFIKSDDEALTLCRHTNGWRYGRSHHGLSVWD